MAKAGIQQMSLPDIYAMFKTASDEDKIKLMNTYANLGERLGEYDKDIDYRRGRGDKDALTEKMYTEGIGDVVGSAWDYTKQGAETAWDYAKKGAKKGAESLRDLIMRDTAVNDLVRGDEYIEEEQLPTNNTPPRVELGGAEEALPSQEHMLLGFGPDSIMERNLRDRLNGLNLEQYPYADNPDTEQKYPAFEPENVFESTMARNLRDRLNGLNLKQYPYDDDWESTNSSTGADVEKEEETLSPQEQRFLGVEPEKEEVVESPMARRMRERLEKLTARQEYYANNPDARWSELYNIDPERATFDWNRIAPKGSGASSVVQARLDHDMEIDKQIAGLSTQLRKDMLANGWTSTSPEFLERYGEIQELEASKYVKGDKNQFEKSVRLTNKETDQNLQADKFEFDKKKEVTKVDKDAFDATNKTMGGLMGEKYSMPAKYGHIANSLAVAVADPNNINEAAIKDAVKAFIQSIDDSVVMSHEAKSFADQSYIGQIKAAAQSILDDNIYSPDRLAEIWDLMDAYMYTYKRGINNIANGGKKFYTKYGGSNPDLLDAWVDLMISDANLPDKPDFSVVGPWWDNFSKSKASKKGTGLKAPVYGDNDVGGIS